MRSRLLAVKLGFRVGVLLTVAVLTVGAGTGAADVHTSARIYTPFTAAGRPAVHVTKTVHGTCATGSIAVAHRGAWRCVAGNVGYDPCFSSAKAKGILLCPTNGPWNSSAVKIKLTKKLSRKYANKRKPSTSGPPWALVTTSGWKCEIDTGGTAVVDGKRLNYFCLHIKDGLWGAPLRKSQPWKIYAAPPRAKKLTKTVAIKSAWF